MESTLPSACRILMPHVGIDSKFSQRPIDQIPGNESNWDQLSISYRGNLNKLFRAPLLDHIIPKKPAERQGASDPKRNMEMEITKMVNPPCCVPGGQDGPKRFTPRLIEIAKASFQSGKSTFALVLDGELEQMSKRICRTSYPCSLANRVGSIIWRPPKSQDSYSNLEHRMQQVIPHSQTYRIDELKDSGMHSRPSSSPSIPFSHNAVRLKTRAQCRRSCDKRFSRRLLSLAAHSAKNQLRDQALVAFPNEQVYHSMSHYAIDIEEDLQYEDPKVEIVPWDAKEKLAPFRRQSTPNLLLELDEMRCYKEKAGINNWEERLDIAEPQMLLPPGVTMCQLFNGTDKSIANASRKEVGTAQTWHPVSPPMLGGDLIFASSLSPHAAYCENDGSTDLHQTDAKNTKCEGLWMGTCRDNGLCPTSSKTSRSSIETPIPDVENRFDMIVSTRQSIQLLAPSAHHPHLSQPSKAVYVDEEVDGEYHDGFVTQVYNYLSLGYPSMARYYDYELSAVAGIPIDDLRRNDLHMDAKGYIGPPKGIGTSERHITGVDCMRWIALRSYIRKWARERLEMAVDVKNLERWGVSERKGSWAV